MERLTFRDENGFAFGKQGNNREQALRQTKGKMGTFACTAIVDELALYEDTNLTPEQIAAMQAELAAYKQAEAEGRIVRTPIRCGICGEEFDAEEARFRASLGKEG